MVLGQLTVLSVVVRGAQAGERLVSAVQDRGVRRVEGQVKHVDTHATIQTVHVQAWLDAALAVLARVVVEALTNVDDLAGDLVQYRSAKAVVGAVGQASVQVGSTCQEAGND